MASQLVRAPAGLRPLTWYADAGVVLKCALVIGSVPGFPAALAYFLWKALRAKEPEDRQRARRWFAAVLTVYLLLMFMPTATRPWFMGTFSWRWFLEYLSVRYVYKSGEAPPPGQYLYLLMPHGLYPFSGACTGLSTLREVFPQMRIAAADIAFRIPFIRQLLGYIGSIRADKASISRALKNGDSVGLFPGGIAEMVRTDANTERLLLKSRKGVVKIAMEHKVPLVPVYVFGQSVLWSHLPLPAFVERLSRWLQASIIVPYGRFGLLVPQKRQLLYAIGDPIPPGDSVDATHQAVVAAVQGLYDAYKGMYGWQNRPLQID